jgi:hypothetical protein
MFGLERLAAALINASHDARLEGVVKEVSQHAGGRPARDDISLLLINCCPETALPELPRHPVAHTPATPGNWRFSLRLSGGELRKLDVVPILLGLANHFDGARDRAGELFVILAELFNNALDHGLLRLDSERKLSPDGMEAWIVERAQRLEALQDGEITLEIEQLMDEDKGWLRVTCRDSGPGFDHAARGEHAMPLPDLPFGRGIALVRQMAADLEYNDAGNEVRATLSLIPMHA